MPKALTMEALARRVSKLEKSLQRLRRDVRGSEPAAGVVVDWTPELEAELDRRYEAMKADAGRGMPLSEFKKELRSKYKLP